MTIIAKHAFSKSALAAAALAIAALAGVCAEQPAAPEAGSSAKLQAIQKIIEDYQKAGERLADPDVKKSIYAEVAKHMPLSPKGKPDDRDMRKLTDEASALAAKKMPDSDAKVAKSAEQEAEKLFVLAEPKQEVFIQYKRGNFIYDVKGVYYGPSGNSVKVGDRTIAMIDILPEHRAKFDKEFNDAKRRDFVNSRIQDYANKKRVLQAEIANSLKDAQAKANEAKGFVFAWKEWRAPKDIVDMLLSSLTSGESSNAPAQEATAPVKQPEPVAAPVKPEPAPVKQPEPVAAPVKPEPAPVKQPEPATEAPQEPKVEIVYEDLKRRVDAKLAEIANSCSGIDSDQGYKSALWGLTRQEVAAILSTEPNKLLQDPNSNIDTITPKDGPIKSIELYYIANTLVKATVWFSISDMEGAMTLRDALIEKYGLTDELVKEKKEAEEEAKLDKAEKADGKDKKDKKKDEKKKDEKKEPELIPLMLIYHWTGKVTSAVVSFKANGTRSAFDEIKLVKMNPALMKKLNDQERRAQEEALKEKRKVDKRKLDF